MFRASALACSVLAVLSVAPVLGAEGKTRVLFVGGDWKGQLPNYKGTTPLRGYFVRQEVEKAAPGRFDFALWTSYEFLQYGDAESLRAFDVIVVGDVMGQSIVPRLVKGLAAYVEGGGGLMYCDNHKAFSFNTVELSFDAVLPIDVVPFRPYGPQPCQPMLKEPVAVKVAAPDHPVVRGLDFSGAPMLKGARHGQPKAGATVLATGPGGEAIWVAWEKGKGRALWTGGVFANDELSADFAAWPLFGKFYAQALAWLAEKSAYPRVAFQEAAASGRLTVGLAKPGPALTAKHFGIHGQEAPGATGGMAGDDLAMYQALNLDGTFARIGAAGDGPKKVKGGKPYEYLDNSTDLAAFDWEKYDFARLDAVLADCDRIRAVPISLYWCPWRFKDVDVSPPRWTKYFAAVLEHTNPSAAAPAAKPRLTYFEIMNEPDLRPAPERVDQYAAFFNSAAGNLKKRYPGVAFGCGGFYEWTYIQAIIDRCAENLGWISRHPYGHTGEAVFALGDRYVEYARARGLRDFRYIVTEWDFWIYGEPAFDYIMQRWKPMANRADVCLGTLHYRWREYQEGGYVFGVHGEFNQKYGELPPEWPNPGKGKPITYRYNAFWAMRDCRGPQYAATIESPELAPGESTRAYALATAEGGRFNIVVYYGYPYANFEKGRTYTKMRLRVESPIPADVKGRTLVVSRADCRTIKQEPPRTISGDRLDLDLEVPALSAVSLTVK